MNLATTVTPETLSTHALRAALASILLALLCSVAGCGGSGSSGFDILPSEARAIAQAIDGGECVEFEVQTICASGVEPVTGDFQGASVTIEAPPHPLVCDDHPPDSMEECTASLEFTTEGFRSPNSLLAAVSENERGPWKLVPLAISEDPTVPRTVTIMVPPADPDATTPRPVLAAVLVYAGLPPEFVPEAAPRLADFGVDLVYVSERLEIVVPR